MGRADELHAEDFQLINPAGKAYSKAEYLGDVGSGEIDYRVWEPGTIAVQAGQEVAVVRYEAEMGSLTRGADSSASAPVDHRDDCCDGQWRVMWSQATRIQEPAS